MLSTWPNISVVASLALLAALTPVAWGKPRSVQVDHAFDQCQWAAEVTIVSGGDIVRGSEVIRVRVTDDADAIFRGHALLGQVVEVRPCVGGPATCSADLLPLVGTGERMLMVVDAGGSIALVGKPQQIDKQAGYHLRTWCDYNAVFFYVKDSGFGKPIGERFEGKYAVTTKQIAARFSAERQALMVALASILVRPRVALPQQQVDAAIARLGDDAFYIREAAQRQLVNLGPRAVPLLQEREQLAKDPEVSARLRTIVRRLQTPLERHAQLIRERGPHHEAQVLLEAVNLASTDETRSAIIFRLQTLAEGVLPQAESGFPSNEAVLDAWRTKLK